MRAGTPAIAVPTELYLFYRQRYIHDLYPKMGWMKKKVGEVPLKARPRQLHSVPSTAMGCGSLCDMRLSCTHQALQELGTGDLGASSYPDVLRTCGALCCPHCSVQVTEATLSGDSDQHRSQPSSVPGVVSSSSVAPFAKGRVGVNAAAQLAGS